MSTTLAPNWVITPEVQEQVDRVFAQWNTRETPGMAIGIYREGVPVYTQAYGMANLEHDIPITTGSIFHIASISKQFTCICVAMLAAEGALNLDDDIRTHLPEVPDFGPTITIRHLMHHTSGLRDQWTLLSLAGWREEDLVTEADVMDLVQRQRALNFAPNTEYLYSNTGYTLLARIVHRVTGQTLRAVADSRIFAPLGMTSTHFHDDHSEIVPGRTQAYLPRAGGGYHISIPEFDVVGTTSLFTTVDDLAKWDANFIHAQVGGADIIADLQTPGTFADGTAMAYGWGLRVDTFRGARRIGHGGADHGYRADYLRLPDLGLTVTVLSNVSNSMPSNLSEQVASLVLGDLLEDNTPKTDTPSRPESAIAVLPADLAGTWRSDDGHSWLSITSRDGVAWVANPEPVELTPRGPGRYITAPLWSLPNLELIIEATSDHAHPESLMTTYAGQSQLYHRQETHLPASADLEAVNGTYWSDELGVTFEVASRGIDADPAIVIRRRKHEDATYTPLVPDVFGCGSLDFGSSITFQRDASGAVSGFTFTQGRVRNLAFTRHG